jgi:serine phosphatase RsbU (regulator of sigma subunit)/Flp pilus assembly protein TadD
MRIKILVIISFLLIADCITAQSINENKIDSLKSLLTKSDDSRKAGLLSEISKLLVKIDPQESIKYGLDAITLAEKVNKPITKAYTYIHLSVASRYLNNVDSSYAYVNKSLNIFEEINFKEGIANANKALGTLNYRKGKFEEAIINQNKAIKLAEELNDSTILSAAVQDIANSYWYLGKFDKALENYLRSLKLAEAKGEKHIIGVALNNLAIYYEYQDNFEEALDYHLRSLEIKRGLGNTQSIGVSLMNLGNVYLELKDYEKAELNINEAIEILEETRNGNYLAYAYGILSKVNNAKGNTQLAIKNLEVAIDYSKQGKSRWGLGENLLDLGYLYMATNRIDLAEKAFNESLELAKETNAINLMKQNYKPLSDILMQRGDYKKASDYLLSFIDVNDSLFNKDKQEAIQEMETKYETEKKEQEIVLLNQEKELNAVSLENEVLLRNSFIGGTFTFLVITIGLFNRYRFKTKTNKKLAELNYKLTDLNEQMEDELNQAASYIQSLLPPKINDRIKTDYMFIPSSQLGGDSFGYSWLNDNLFSFYLIDVSGHGVGSALLSTTVLNLLKTKNLPDADFTDPASVLNSLNRNFDMDEHEGKYFAIWYGVMDIENNELSCASAMHPPALNINNDGITKLGKKDIMIGAFPEYEYNNSYYQLSNGDKVYLFSDGCFEIGSEQKNALEFDDFTKILHNNSKSIKPLENIFSELSSINMSENFGDDYSIIELEVNHN